MKTVCVRDKCAGCMACIDNCPSNAIKIFDSMKAYNAVIDENLCINCDLCHRICPNNNPVFRQKPIAWHEGWACDTLRRCAASGGVASEIMIKFIDRGGYVASCLFENGKFSFDITNKQERIRQFVGSKYVKSNPTGIYRRIRNLLCENKNVLFLGLPCQIAGLKNYLNHCDDSNLYTIDLICHGSPSPLILNKFLEENDIDINSINDIRFRRKTIFGIPEKTNGEKYIEISPTGVQDMYTYAFLNALDYTENCYSCPYASLERVSDITLGDSWSSEQSEAEQMKGISLILCQTEKGIQLINNSELFLKKIDLMKAIEANQQLKHPSLMPPERNTFFENISKGFYKAFAKSNSSIYYRKKIKKFLIQTNIIKAKMGGVIEYLVMYK